jgi:hypothetical protein
VTDYIHDGITFDLGRQFADVTGVVWSWTGAWSEAGEPLMNTTPLGADTAVPLPDVYRDHGPLLTLPAKPSAALRKAVVCADYAASVAAGLVETYEQYAVRTAQAAAQATS